MRKSFGWASMLGLALVLTMAAGCTSSGRRGGGDSGGGPNASGEGEGEGEGEAGEGEGEGVNDGGEGEGEGGQEGEGEGSPVDPGDAPCIQGSRECGTCITEFSQSLGGACGITRQCHPAVVDSQEALDECLGDQCEVACGAGYCTQQCNTDEDCMPAIDGPVGEVFTCHFSGGERGQCRPGSRQPCATDANCDDSGESCQVAVTRDGSMPMAAQLPRLTLVEVTWA